MKKVMLFLFVAILATSCNAQESKIKKDDIAKAKEKTNSIKVPKGSWKVNKELDENGNIIRYDSIYTWSSSKDIKGLNEFENDSLLQKMQSMMKKQFSMFNNPNPFYFRNRDSIMEHFFSDDFFSKDFSQDIPNMQDMMKRMEAIRQQFFNDRKQYVIPPETTEKKTISIEKKQV